jgi:cytochrome c
MITAKITATITTKITAVMTGVFCVMGSVAFAAPLGDAKRGEALFRDCSACHQVGPEARNRVGPHLNNIFDRKAGSVEGVNYSKGLTRMGADGLVWNFETLDAYIDNPKALVSDTRMAYRGMKDPTDRADLLAYLREYSASPANIPESAPTARPSPEVTLSPEVLSIAGDVAYGEYLSSECMTCHLRSGTNDGIPGIVGWPAEDFVVAMHAYKQKIRPHPVMQMMAGRLSNEEIAALAAYFEGLE